MDKVRTFIAVKLPVEIRRRLMVLEKRLMQSGADVKWVTEDNVHITLKFLGAVDQKRVSEVCKAVEAAVTDMEPFELTLAGVGAFPKPSRPNVVWVGLTSGRDELKSLAMRVEDALAELDFPKEDRPFSAHVTLGRVRSGKGLDELSECIEDLKEEPIGAARVDGASVMKSDLNRTGPTYTALADCGFRS